MTSFHLLGPISLSEDTHAFLGLEISSDHQIEPVVIVWLPGDTHDSTLEQLKAQAQAAATLKHSNILRLHGLYELDGRLARIVDYVDGEPLQRFLEVEKSLPVHIAARIVCDAAEGVHHAHTAVSPPWIHGALRPETLMLSFSGLTRVSGYGAQLFAHQNPSESRLRSRRKHIAPEQIVGGNDTASVQTDVYLLGLCLYECITGMLPFIAETNFEEAVLSRPLPPMPPETPSALETVIAKACAKQASERYASAWEFRQAIISAVGLLPSHEALADALNAWIPPTEKSRHHRQQLMDEGLNQILSRHPFAPKTNPEDFIPPPVDAEYLPEQPLSLLEKTVAGRRPLRQDASYVSPDAMTLPPFQVGAPDAITQMVPASVFAAQHMSFRSSPPRAYDDEEEFEEPPSSSKVPWVVGILLAASAIAVIAYFIFAPSAPLEPVKVAAPVVATPPPRLPPPPVLPEVPPPAPKPAANTKSSSSKTVSKTKSSAANASTTASARVNIQAAMPLDISFKGKRIGKTPAQVSLPAGNVTLLFSNKSAGIRIKRSLELSPEQTVDLNVQLEKGRLNVNAPAGAQISINGVHRGTAPLGDIELWEGEHRLSVRYNDQTLTESFSLAPGGYMHYDIMATSN